MLNDIENAKLRIILSIVEIFKKDFLFIIKNSVLYIFLFLVYSLFLHIGYFNDEIIKLVKELIAISSILLFSTIIIFVSFCLSYIFGKYNENKFFNKILYKYLLFNILELILTLLHPVFGFFIGYSILIIIYDFTSNNVLWVFMFFLSFIILPLISTSIAKKVSTMNFREYLKEKI